MTLSFIVDQQVRELEVDLDNETRRSAEQQKISKKTERRLKDVLQQQEEDQKNLQHFKDQIDRLNKKIKSTKVNQEEAVRPLSFVLALSSLLLPPSPLPLSFVLILIFSLPSYSVFLFFLSLRLSLSLLSPFLSLLHISPFQSVCWSFMGLVVTNT